MGRVFVGNSVYDASRVQINCGLQGAVMLLMSGDNPGSIKLSNGATIVQLRGTDIRSTYFSSNGTVILRGTVGRLKADQLYCDEELRNNILHPVQRMTRIYKKSYATTISNLRDSLERKKSYRRRIVTLSGNFMDIVLNQEGVCSECDIKGNFDTAVGQTVHLIGKSSQITSNLVYLVTK